MLMVRARSRESFTSVPLTEVMTSPASIPAFAAGLPSCGLSTIAPLVCFRPRLSAMSAVTGRTCTPSPPGVMEPLSLRWARRPLHAEPAARDVALVLELGDDELRRSGWNVEADADRPARRREDRGVHADHVAVHVESRTAGIALVDRRVDLDVVVIGPRADIAAAGGDDAGRHGAAEAEGIADTDQPVADPRRVGRELHVR